MKKCSSSLLIREIETKITGRYSFICIKMIIVKKTETQKIATVGKDIDKRETARIASKGHNIVQPHQRTALWSSEKLSIEPRGIEQLHS